MERTSRPTTACNLVHGNFDVAEFAYVSPLDPLGGYLVYTTVGIPDNPPHDGQNVTRISLPVLDSAYLTVLTNVDFSKVRDAMYTVQDIYGSDQNTYELPLYYRKDVWLVNPKLHNFTGNPTTAPPNGTSATGGLADPTPSTDLAICRRS